MTSTRARGTTIAWVAVVLSILAAAPILAASFASRHDGGIGVSLWALLLAAVWFAGGGIILWQSGRPRRERTFLGSRGQRTAIMLGAGVVLALGSLGGGLLLAAWPQTAPLVNGPLEAAVSQPLLVLFSVALVAGAAEEVFFRLAMPRLLTGWWRWILPTALYTVVTLFSGTPALALMAAILSVVAMWTLERTGWWFAPIVVHAMWTVMMIVVFPLVAR